MQDGKNFRVSSFVNEVRNYLMALRVYYI